MKQYVMNNKLFPHPFSRVSPESSLCCWIKVSHFDCMLPLTPLLLLQSAGRLHQAVPHVWDLHREEPGLCSDAVQELQAHLLLVLSGESGRECSPQQTSLMWHSRVWTRAVLTEHLPCGCFNCRVTSSWDIMTRGRAKTSWDTPGPPSCGTEHRWGTLPGLWCLTDIRVIVTKGFHILSPEVVRCLFLFTHLLTPETHCIKLLGKHPTAIR